MKRCRTLAALLLLVLLSSSSLAATWVYSDFGNLATSISIETEAKSGAVGDLSMPLSVCPLNSEYHCFKLGSLSFSVPKRSDSGSRSWSYEGQTYVVVRSQSSAHILGRQVDVLTIDSMSQSPQMRFYYSYDAGLLALRGIGGDSGVLVLQEQCGFGASKKCVDANKPIK